MATPSAEPLATRAALPPLRLPVNAFATAVGAFIFAVSQWGVLVVLARLGSPALVGQFAMGVAVAGPVMLLAGLQLRAVQVTDASDEHRFSEYLALRMTAATVAIVAIVAIAWLVGVTRAGALVIALVGLAKAVESVSDIYRGAMQRRERMDRVAVSRILQGVGGFVGLTSVLLLGGGLASALVVLVAANVLVWRTWDVAHVRISGGMGVSRRERSHTVFGVAPTFDPDGLLRLARTSAPLGAVAVLLSLNAYAPQWAVRHAHGDAALGFFAAVLVAAMASAMLVNAVGMAASPRLATLYAEADARGFRSLHRKLLVVAAAVGGAGFFGALLIGRPALGLVYGSAYADHAGLLAVLCAVAALVHLVSVQGYAVTAARRFRGQVPVACLVAATTTLLAFSLVPTLGATGAALAMLGGAVVQGAGYSALLIRALNDLDVGVAGEVHRVAA